MYKYHTTNTWLLTCGPIYSKVVLPSEEHLPLHSGVGSKSGVSYTKLLYTASIIKHKEGKKDYT